MRASLDRDDYEAILVIGHNMRGSGGGFGFQSITDIGAALEQAADAATSCRCARNWTRCPVIWTASRRSRWSADIPRQLRPPEPPPSGSAGLHRIPLDGLHSG
ncbi:MAG: hypothetical protein WDN45_15675 [Caulobacteraceae bacterium]